MSKPVVRIHGVHFAFVFLTALALAWAMSTAPAAQAQVQNELCDPNNDENPDDILTCELAATSVTFGGAVPTATFYGAFCSNPIVSIGSTNGAFSEALVLSSNSSQITIDLTGNVSPGDHSVHIKCPCTNCDTSLTVGGPGPQGQQGGLGVPGPPGPVGPVGPVGPTGLSGPTGVQGPPGPMGLQGQKGATGPTGLQPAKGPTGPTGGPGGAGLPGKPGSGGAQGPQGKQGPAGPAGPTGVKGGTGPKGPKGATGPKGPTGGGIGSDGDCTDCCAPDPAGAPGCNGPVCQGTVCAIDPFCCSVAWDSVCAGEANSLCTCCGGGVGTGTGTGGCGDGCDCCVPDPAGAPGCCDPSCEGTVCAGDPFCCSVNWDDNCASEAFSLCACCGGGTGTGTGGVCDCCVPDPVGAPGCNDADCQAAVCGADPFCCSVNFDSICSGEAKRLCACCGGGGGDTCDCCVPDPAGAAGCDDRACQATICAFDPFCCSVSWDSICSGEATSLCTCCGDGGGDTCDCCVPDPAGAAGCDDRACQATICAFDPFCCSVSWDSICSSEATSACTCCGGGGGDRECDCCAADPSGATGCDDATCQGSVCGFDPFCCSVEWDSICAAEAISLCSCCSGAGSCTCCVPGATPGCSDATCQGKVCAFDPFCCSVSWDVTCAADAQVECLCCAGGNDPGGGFCDCCAPDPSGSTGCSDFTCQNTVCGVDPFCCSVEWDSICAGEAVSLCSCCG